MPTRERRREKSSSPPRQQHDSSRKSSGMNGSGSHLQGSSREKQNLGSAHLGDAPHYRLYKKLLPWAQCLMVFCSLVACIQVRLHAVATYGKVIHEFDPWFNFRATKYLVENGWKKFSTWHDYESWYPLGRPVGTTVYPGLMVTAASVFHVSETTGLGWSLNDICVYIPAAFAVISCLSTYGITLEVSSAKGSHGAAALACGLMAVIPAHLMRSVAGGYDNEAVAVPAINECFP